MRDGSSTTQLTAEASGSWTITMGGLDQATRAMSAVSGEGDDVVLMSGSTWVTSVTNSGSSNFAVHVLAGSNSSIDLAVNEIGSFSGTIPLIRPRHPPVSVELALRKPPAAARGANVLVRGLVSW